MFCIIDTENNHKMVKSGFKTGSQANHWAKKNLPNGTVHMWGAKWSPKLFAYRYLVKER